MTRKRLCILDLDGVLYGADPQVVDSAALHRLVSDRFEHLAIYTNDVTYPKSERLLDLSTNGIQASESVLFTPIDVLFRYVMPKMAAERCFFIGESDAVPEVWRPMSVNCLTQAQCVAVGDIRDLDLEEIARELNEAEHLALPVFTLNENAALVDGGRDIGDLVTTLAGLLRRPKILVGKPSPLGFLALLDWFGVDASAAVLVTDSVFNDAHGAAAVGVDTVLVSSAPHCPTSRFISIDDFMRSLISSPADR